MPSWDTFLCLVVLQIGERVCTMYIGISVRGMLKAWGITRHVDDWI